MVVRKIKTFAGSLALISSGVLLFLFVSASAQACFGPKLFAAAGKGSQADVLFALVTLYVEEKTGVESLRVEIEKGVDPLMLLADEKADLVFVATDKALDNTILQVPGAPVLVTGKRPLEELQFTTVLPAIKKLNGLLEVEDVSALVAQVDAGESAMAAVRRFLMERRWI